MLSVAEARARIVRNAPLMAVENVALDSARGRTLATDLAARLTQPPFDSSAMDGYAGRAADVAHPPSTLRVIGEAAAGRGFAGPLGSGEAVRIFTGAPVPEGADCVVIQEECTRNDDRVVVNTGAAPGQYIRPQGFDFKSGDKLLNAGRILTSRDISLAAQMGHGRLPVRKRPRVAILATGDELVAPGETPGRDQIVSSIPVGLAGLIEMAGGAPHLLGIARDDRASLEAHIAKAEGCDILVTIGGASVGAHDLVRSTLEARGLALDFWKIAMRPGKPLMFGMLEGMRVLGLPGNPVSALICGRVFLVPLIRAMLGAQSVDETLRPAPIPLAPGETLPANGPREHYMRAVFCDPSGGSGTAAGATAGADPAPSLTTARAVQPLPSQDSSLLSLLAKADCLIVRPPHAPAAGPGEPVPVITLDF